MQISGESEYRAPVKQSLFKKAAVDTTGSDFMALIQQATAQQMQQNFYSSDTQKPYSDKPAEYRNNSYNTELSQKTDRPGYNKGAADTRTAGQQTADSAVTEQNNRKPVNDTEAAASEKKTQKTGNSSEADKAKTVDEKTAAEAGKTGQKKKTETVNEKGGIQPEEKLTAEQRKALKEAAARLKAGLAEKSGKAADSETEKVKADTANDAGKNSKNVKASADEGNVKKVTPEPEKKSGRKVKLEQALTSEQKLTDKAVHTKQNRQNTEAAVNTTTDTLKHGSTESTGQVKASVQAGSKTQAKEARQTGNNEDQNIKTVNVSRETEQIRAATGAENSSMNSRNNNFRENSFSARLANTQSSSQHDTDAEQPVSHLKDAGSNRPALTAEKLMPEVRQNIREQIDRVMQRARIQVQQNGNARMSINLYPKEFGRIQVHLTMVDGALQGRMTVDNELIQKEIQDKMNRLADEFREMGMDVESFTVDVRSENTDSSGSLEQYRDLRNNRMASTQRPVDNIYSENADSKAATGGIYA